MNTSPLDFPWYRNGCECMDSFCMAIERCSSSSASSSSLATPSSAEAGDGGAMVNGEEVRMSSAARDVLACGRSGGGIPRL